ncbi:MAG: Dps family protein [Gammaproteobacteria bacterium]|nr:Dps family protein [Gammaproteobacteria bacterium]
MTAKDINIGIDSDDRQQIAGGLTRLLADTYTLYLKTHSYHWNVTGPRFRDLHLLFEEQYTELAAAVDDIAERIRTLGYPAPGTFREYLELTAIEEIAGAPEAEEMLSDLVVAQEILVRTCREILPTAQEANDESTASLVADRMAIHEKAAWMLRSLL